MGKTRKWKWGLFFALCLLITAAVLNNPVTKSPIDGAPEPAGTPAPQGPLAGCAVCLDPGHGGYDGGAYGRDSGTPEKELNLDVALRLAGLLRERGAAVTLTRETDTALADAGENRKRRDLQARVDAAASADLFLSIHMNEYRTRSQSGPQVFYRKGQEGSRLLAGVLQQSLNASLSPARPRGAQTGDYYVLRQLAIPAVLVECGFLSNAAEEQKLLDPDYRQRLAQAIADGVEEYWALAPERKQ